MRHVETVSDIPLDESVAAFLARHGHEQEGVRIGPPEAPLSQDDAVRVSCTAILAIGDQDAIGDHPDETG